ncbi:MAG: hypothetical protein KGJ80_09685 [Chloroflexota bacterium]|nr:hypothetical protein [Chloroflexota bacterium]
MNASKRLDAIEKSSAARIAHAKQIGDLSELSAEEMAQVEADARSWILAHPAEWRAHCESLAGRFGESAAGAMQELRFEDLDTPTLESILAEVRQDYPHE